ncbi:hypothetical protein [uncultured Methanolobus sp.]|uniref:hypothetical protein n=1 Tax=uncultured Methanolobus sp. TaxID=218300 RepID=UPI002AAC07BA|nr:hypothetical protein [uncultured Methanolobus sp.]
MTNSNVMNIITDFLGTPTSDVEVIIFMLVAACFLVLMLVSVLDIFKLIASHFGHGRR